MPTEVCDYRAAINERQSSDDLPASKEVEAGPSRLQSVVFSLSLANLCFLTVWKTAIDLAGNSEMQHFEMAPPSFGFVASVLADIFALATVVYLLFHVRRRVSRLRVLGSVCLSGICSFALLEIEQSFVQQLKLAHSDGVQIGIAVGTFLLAIVSIRRTKAVARALVMVLSPLLPLLTIDAAWLYSRPELKLLRTERVAGKLPYLSSHSRLIWIIFDEMDYHLAFETRPPRLQMPEFDRLREISIFGDRAQSPAGQTILSMPSLLTGGRVVEERHRANNIALRFEGRSAWRDLSSQPNVFGRARAAGLNTAVAGWHLPYCRLIGSDLSECASAPNGTESVVFYNAVAVRSFWSRTFSIALWHAESLAVERTLFRRCRSFWLSHSERTKRLVQPDESRTAMALYSLANIRSRAVREQQISAATFITENALRMARDPDLNLILVHAPAPHLPGIWNSRTKQFTATEPSDYVDNLGFTDFVLGQIRTTLEENGDWDQTSLLISADHPFRAKGWQQSSLWSRELAEITKGQQLRYIPFILKLPGQSTPITYHREFNTVVSGDLILDILKGNVKSPEEAVRWLDSH